MDNSRDGGLSADAKSHIASEGNRQKRLRQVVAFQLRQQSFSNSPDAARLSPEKGRTETADELTAQSSILVLRSNTSPSQPMLLLLLGVHSANEPGRLYHHLRLASLKGV